MKRLGFTIIILLSTLLGVFYLSQPTTFPKLLNNCQLKSDWTAVSCHCDRGIKLYNNDQKKALSHFSKAAKSIQILEDNSTINWNKNPKKLDLTIQIYQQLCQLREETDDLSAAMDSANRSLDYALIKYGADATPLYAFYNKIGRLLDKLQEFDASMDYYKKAIYILEKEHGTYQNYKGDKVALGKSYANLGYAHLKWGVHNYAMDYYNKALQLIENQENTIPLQIEIHKRIAHLCLYICTWDQAYEGLNRSDSLWSAHREQYIGDKEYYRLKRGILWSYGYFKKCERKYDETFYYFKEAANYMKPSVYGYTDNEDLRTLLEIGEIYNNKRDEAPRFRDSSILYVQKALHAAAKNFTSFDISTLPKIEQLRDQSYVYEILNTLARFNQQRAFERADEVEKIQSLELALSYIDLVDSFHVNNLRKSVNLRGGQLLKLIENSIRTYNYGLLFSQLLHDIKPGQAIIEKAFYFAQRKKAQQLNLVYLKEQFHEKENLPDSTILLEKQLFDDMVQFEKKLIEAKQAKDTFLINLYQNSFLFESKRAHKKLQNKLAVDYPKYFKSQFDFHLISIQSLQRALKIDEILVEIIQENNSGYAFVVEKNQPPKMINLFPTRPENHATNRAIIDIYKLLQNSQMNRVSSREKFVELSHFLYQQYISPIEKDLAGKKRLILIGDYSTHYLPFEILLKSDEVKPFDELDFLIEDIEVSYHYSSSLFAKSKRKTQDAVGGIYAFAPVYDEVENSTFTASSLSEMKIDTSLRAFDRSGNFIPLPASETETTTIAGLFESNPTKNSTISLRTTATESSLKRNLEKPYKFIHLAGHSFANISYPKFSGIACYRDEENPSEDGILHVGEIYNLDIQADLITLSSCESGLGKLVASDGLVGLNRAFIYAGSSNVVFSMWKVYDKVSAELMIDFYENVLSGKTYSASLKAAKLNLLKEESTASPHFWSPFLLIGR